MIPSHSTAREISRYRASRADELSAAQGKIQQLGKMRNRRVGGGRRSAALDAAIKIKLEAERAYARPDVIARARPLCNACRAGLLECVRG